MSHSVFVTIIADQEIRLLGDVVNIHDLHSISLNSRGEIISYGKRTEPAHTPDVVKLADHREGVCRTCGKWVIDCSCRRR